MSLARGRGMNELHVKKPQKAEHHDRANPPSTAQPRCRSDPTHPRREGAPLRATKALVAARGLDKAARRRSLTPYHAARLLSLRARQSDLHTELAAGTAALRLVRAMPDAPASEN